MANRRMLSKSVVGNDRFCRLKSSSQALYMHLILSADDDGFVDMWKSILRYLSIRRTALQELEDAGYVIVFGDEVLFISDWYLHNRVSQDRYIKSPYKDRLDTLVLQENGRYSKA